MEKTPIHRFSRSAALLVATAAAMPVVSTSAHAGDGYGSSGLAQRELIRRQEAVREADQLLLEGRKAYKEGDYAVALEKFTKARNNLQKNAPILDDRYQVVVQHVADASVALSQKYRKEGKYNEARELLNNVLAADVDPENAAAKRELGYLDDPIRTNPALTYEHTQNIDKVRRTLYLAEGYYNLGKYDEARREYQNVLRIDPYNVAARRGMEVANQAKRDYYKAAYDEARSTLLTQVDQAWELAVPADAPVGGTGTTGPVTDSSGATYILNKLRTIVIPVIDFEDTTVEEAIDFLRQRSVELDRTETDPARKGVNFVVRKPTGDVAAAATAAGEAPVLGGGDPGAQRIKELKLRNVPLSDALKYICDATKLRTKVDDFAVTLVPATETGEDLFNRTFRVPPDFMSTLDAGGDSSTTSNPDPFASTGSDSSGGGMLRPRPPLIELLKAKGIPFPEGTSANYLAGSGTLVVRNTPTNIDLIEQLIEGMTTQAPKQIQIMTKFVEISQENTEELSFDWVVTPFGIGGDLIGGGGSQGNGSPVRGNGDFTNVGNFLPLNPNPPAGAQAGDIVSAGNRTGDGAIARNSIDAVINNPNRTAQTANAAPGILSLTGIFGEDQVQMMMRGLSQKKGTDVLTAPSIVAKSGQKGKIEIIREFIYPTEYEPPELPNSVGVGNNGNDNAVGAAAAAIFPVTPATPTAFETRNTGVTLEIEPTLAANDYVIDLRFAPEIVEFEGFVNYGSPIQSPAADALGNPISVTITENRIEMPVFSTRKVDTQLTIYDGHTVAVGGLMREDVQNVEDSIPILGDLPVVGRLFQSKAENRIKSNLIVFVTAKIIDATGRPLRDSVGNTASNMPPSDLPPPPTGSEPTGAVLPPPIQ